MTVVVWGSSLTELFQGNPDTAAAVITTAAQLAPYVEEGVSSNYAAATPPFLALTTPLSELWVSYYGYNNNTASNCDAVYFQSNGVDLFRVLTTSSTGLKMQHWSGSAWVDSFTAATGYGQNVLFRHDIHIKIADSGGQIELYNNNNLVGTFTGDTLLTAATTIDKIIFKGYSVSNPCTWSGCFVADEDSRGITYIGRRPSGAGGVTQWTGTYADVDETGQTDSDFVYSTAADQVITFAKASLPAGFSSGYQVIGIGVTARAAKGGTGSTKMQLAVRQASTNGFSGDKNLITALQKYQHLFTLNPATAAAFTYSEAGSAETGVKSIT